MPPTARGMPCTAHRLFLASLLVACKYLQDQPIRNRSWSYVMTRGKFSLAEVNLMERQFLFLMGFRLFLDEEEIVRRGSEVAYMEGFRYKEVGRRNFVLADSDSEDDEKDDMGTPAPPPLAALTPPEDDAILLLDSTAAAGHPAPTTVPICPTGSAAAQKPPASRDSACSLSSDRPPPSRPIAINSSSPYVLSGAGPSPIPTPSSTNSSPLMIRAIHRGRDGKAGPSPAETSSLTAVGVQRGTGRSPGVGKIASIWPGKKEEYAQHEK
ncbi:hypothetical protein HK101_003107 [Irineochytrium annulatum]|nr:hypothetical protein HK101_003107 [Irineochytrium annulatum]